MYMILERFDRVILYEYKKSDIVSLLLLYVCGIKYIFFSLTIDLTEIVKIKDIILICIFYLYLLATDVFFFFNIADSNAVHMQYDD